MNLFWKKDFDLQVISSSKNHIEALINRGKDNGWCFTGFYGEPATHLRSESWDLIHTLHRQYKVPWLCTGDFDELLKYHEKLGGCLRPYGQIQKFRKVLDECRLLDLGFVGNKFTWFKTYLNKGVVWERLDRAVSTAEWYELFPAIKVQNLVCGSSDHNPILILLEGFTVKPQRPWRFEQMWLDKEGCHDTVQRAWKVISLGSMMVQVIHKVEACQVKLKQRSKHAVCNMSNTLKEKKKKRKTLFEESRS